MMMRVKLKVTLLSTDSSYVKNKLHFIPQKLMMKTCKFRKGWEKEKKAVPMKRVK
jgi:hypothetical protein